MVDLLYNSELSRESQETERDDTDRIPHLFVNQYFHILNAFHENND